MKLSTPENLIGEKYFAGSSREKNNLRADRRAIFTGINFASVSFRYLN
jgi:hypothetical protein